MSSLVRRIQKGIAKAQGYFRYTDGLIYDGNFEAIGRRWPQVRAATAPSKPKKPKKPYRSRFNNKES